MHNARQAIWEQLNEVLANEWERLGDDATDDDFDMLLEKMAEDLLTFEANESLPAFLTTIRSFFGVHAENILNN